MARILIDTSVIIDFLRQRDKSKTLLFNLAHSNYDLCASIITYAESYAGKSVWEKPDARKALETLFSNIKILPMGEELSRKAGEISANYDTDIIDAIIAATAMVHRISLVTLNIKDFKEIDGITLWRA